MKRLEGRIALITGCNRGIGKAILETFVKEGCSIIACSRTPLTQLALYYQDLREKYNVDIYPLYFDLENEDAIREAMKQLYKMKLTIDILVNNAGISNTDGIMRLKMSDAHRVMQVNYFAPLLITQYVVKLMLKSKNASIINVGSVAALKPTVGNSVYGASKAALMSASRCWAKELGGINIRVNAIAPGYVQTDMLDSINQEIIESLVGQISLKRTATVEEIAKAVLFLASDDASYVDGQILELGVE